MKLLILVAMLLPCLSFSQGIEWTKDLSWEQIKQKAKNENKYIFLDCYTTWCGPCKMMDKEVYVHDSVGILFNEKFISVKVQMDRTKNDDAFIQSWYKDADAIGKQYKIEGFPSFVFLAPNGNVTNQAAGYTTVNKFMETAQLALKPGQVYDDPYAEYDRLLTDYKQGILHYDRMWYFIQAAKKFDPTIVPDLTGRYSGYIDKLDENQHYQKDIIAFWASNVFDTRSKLFSFFYKNEKKVNEVMKRGNYVADIIDKEIYNEIVIPFFNEQNTNPNLPMMGMYLNGIEPDYSEADWKKLDKTLRKKFNKSIAKRNVLESKVEWYNRHFNLEATSRVQLILLEKYPPDLREQCVAINTNAYDAFEKLSDRKILSGYIEWMEKVVKKYEYPQFLDTYACLLYKVGRKDEAIAWENKAAIKAAKYKKIVQQMENGEPVNGVKPI